MFEVTGCFRGVMLGHVERWERCGGATCVMVSESAFLACYLMPKSGFESRSRLEFTRL